MKRLHVLILLIVLLVLALFALRVDNEASPPQSTQGAPIGAPDAPPSGAAGREDQAVGTTGLPHTPGGAERP